mmetsp:Transcript_631/g.1179  ORF Transcript_631/g.1179 Transcript_631/m.1179 type:complete len:90 (-) Transcript_631:1361-1630(-)
MFDLDFCKIVDNRFTREITCVKNRTSSIQYSHPSAEMDSYPESKTQSPSPRPHPTTSPHPPIMTNLTLLNSAPPDEYSLLPEWESFPSQ